MTLSLSLSTPGRRSAGAVAFTYYESSLPPTVSDAAPAYVDLGMQTTMVLSGYNFAPTGTIACVFAPPH
eukprot:5275213-Pleurochrysis_carterae.AAC.1